MIQMTDARYREPLPSTTKHAYLMEFEPLAYLRHINLSDVVQAVFAQACHLLEGCCETFFNGRDEPDGSVTWALMGRGVLTCSSWANAIGSGCMRGAKQRPPVARGGGTGVDNDGVVGRINSMSGGSGSDVGRSVSSGKDRRTPHRRGVRRLMRLQLTSGVRSSV